jgi:hypothetical protein
MEDFIMGEREKNNCSISFKRKLAGIFMMKNVMN